jgi:hypothetical protein
MPSTFKHALVLEAIARCFSVLAIFSYLTVLSIVDIDLSGIWGQSIASIGWKCSPF